jgi:hypothetical protein
MSMMPFPNSFGRTVVLSAVAWVFLTSFPCAASAQTRSGFGVRAGVGANPDQFHFGAHYDTGPLFDRLSFRPNLEVGVGDDVTTIAANFEFAYWIPIKRKPWAVYVGGGPALVISSFDEGHGSDTQTEPGFNLLVGLGHSRGFFAEAKLGLIDSPEAKFTVGYTWK